MDGPTEFTREVKARLKRRGWTQRKLADRIGLKQSDMSTILNGRKKLPPARLKKLLDALDIRDRERTNLTALYARTLLAGKLGGLIAPSADSVREYTCKVSLSGGIDVLLEATEKLSSLPAKPGVAATRAYLRDIVDVLLLVEDAIHLIEYVKYVKRLVEATRTARAPGDFAVIVARIASAFMRIIPSKANEDVLDRLYGLLRRETAERYHRIARGMCDQDLDGDT